MYKNKNILAVVPARGGSKGIKHKNLCRIKGKSLIEHVSLVTGNSEFIDKVIVSTDSDKIAEEAKKYNMEVPFYRPADLSGDRVGDLEVLSHALIETEKIDKIKYDVILMLQPTSPLRTKKHISDAIKMLVNENRDSVCSVSETDSKSHPLKQLMINKDDCLLLYDEEGKNIIARQQLNTLYHRNGLVYAFTRECILNKHAILTMNTAALLTKGMYVSIDTLWDIKLTEFIINENIN